MTTLTRAQIGKAEGIDITVKSADGPATYFSPNWDMVTGHKLGRLSDQAYTAAYIQILDWVPKHIWHWLWRQGHQTGTVTLLCYCRDGWFCHTHLLIDYAVAKWPKAFRKA